MNVRTIITWLTYLLAVTAFAGSYAHCVETVQENGAAGWIIYATAAMPEAMVLTVVLKVKSSSAGWATWVTGVSAVGFTISANLEQAEPSPWGMVIAVWPAWAALCALAISEFGGEPAVTHETNHAEPEMTHPEPAVTLVDPPVNHAEPDKGHTFQHLTLIDPPVNQDQLSQWLTEQLTTPRKKTDIYAEATDLFGVSLSTVKRRASALAA